ncbi:uncharacterized protein DUF397 [Herbihabitans rhizosphaerae]|uniref:Uncharacterized protein DUF397 n=1 Tax=Herbihabitans rhizosphaerae TaxID=1872711 RepID=A0A4Q7KLL9_9PSEU|nr:DUF397 domain-containing protein [Herbihabitans rhizosphaerae]RZS37144.1 uncharacterized protein DUF397 [Herbihabitans rhizosphaerae]
MITADFGTARWRTSSYSGDSGNCVEVAFTPAAWRTSSFSTNSGDCVEVAVAGGAVGLRDSKHPVGTPLVVTAGSFAGLVDAVRTPES